MKTTPKTDQQLAEEGMLPAGEYDFSIDKAEEKVSKKAKEAGATEPDMIQVDLTIFHAGGERRVRDWLSDKMGWKIKHFAYAIGVGQDYENGALDATMLVGRMGRLKLRMGKANGDFPPKNEVADYIVPVGPEVVKPAANASPRPAPAAAGADEPPF